MKEHPYRNIELKGVQYVNDHDSKRDYASHSQRPVRRAPRDVPPSRPADPFLLITEIIDRT